MPGLFVSLSGARLRWEAGFSSVRNRRAHNVADFLFNASEEGGEAVGQLRLSFPQLRHRSIEESGDSSGRLGVVIEGCGKRRSILRCITASSDDALGEPNVLRFEFLDLGNQLTDLALLEVLESAGFLLKPSSCVRLRH
jgi:hypothetical protein